MNLQIMGGIWDQHLDQLNQQRVFSPIAVVLVQTEKPLNKGMIHTEHVHPYWQMEVVVAGGFSIRFGKEELKPKGGDIVLIPPGCSHLFVHPRGKRGWTFKFSAEELTGLYPASIMAAGAPRKCLHRALLDAVETSGRCPDDGMRVVIEHLIAAVLASHLGQARPSLAEDEMIGAARKLVESRVSAGKAVSVAELAKAARCSTPYLNRIFRRFLGVPAKTFADQYRFEIARRLLLETSLSVGEVAAELGFADAFRFSRFFKRLNGDSPRAYRDRHQSGGGAAAAAV